MDFPHDVVENNKIIYNQSQSFWVFCLLSLEAHQPFLHPPAVEQQPRLRLNDTVSRCSVSADPGFMGEIIIDIDETMVLAVNVMTGSDGFSSCTSGAEG